MAAGTLVTASSDERAKGQSAPVARIQTATLSWATGAGFAAQTSTVFVSGTIYRMDVVISTVTGNADLVAAITCADDNGCVVGNELDHAAQAHSATHYYDSQSSKDDDGNFNAVAHHGNITVTVTPNEDAGGTAQTLSVTVIFFVR